MTKQKKLAQYLTPDGNLRPLTPLEATVLQAFGRDARSHDRVTIAVWLLGGRCGPAAALHAAKRLAGITLQDLVAMGYLVTEADGWARQAADAEVTR